MSDVSSTLFSSVAVFPKTDLTPLCLVSFLGCIGSTTTGVAATGVAATGVSATEFATTEFAATGVSATGVSATIFRTLFTPEKTFLRFFTIPSGIERFVGTAPPLRLVRYVILSYSIVRFLYKSNYNSKKYTLRQTQANLTLRLNGILHALHIRNFPKHPMLTPRHILAVQIHPVR